MTDEFTIEVNSMYIRNLSYIKKTLMNLIFYVPSENMQITVQNLHNLKSQRSSEL
jgi:hypothetical protein